MSDKIKTLRWLNKSIKMISMEGGNILNVFNFNSIIQFKAINRKKNVQYIEMVFN